MEAFMNKLSSAVIGLGNIGLLYDLDPRRIMPSSHVMAYHMDEEINLLAVTDIDCNKKNKLKALGIETNFYSENKMMMDRQKVDIVSICTPPGQHFKNIREVIDRSFAKLIFCEKPIVNHLDEARLLRRYAKEKGTFIIPNISRRWLKGIEDVHKYIVENEYGAVEKVHVRYTRGIYNTGAHLFDLLKMFCGKIKRVQVLQKVYTTADLENDPSFSFWFENESGSYGFCEAFNDAHYYMFEIDLYFAKGKIEIRNSGDDIFYYRTDNHHLFSGFKELVLERQEGNLLKESCLSNAIINLKNVLRGNEMPKCNLEDAIYSLYIAEALINSYKHNWLERVEYDEE